LLIKYLVSFSNKNHSCLKVDQILTPETAVHRFWDYPKAKAKAAAWEWAFTIIHSVSDPPQRRERKKAFDVK
jgi:hypothetical protein